MIRTLRTGILFVASSASRHAIPKKTCLQAFTTTSTTTTRNRQEVIVVRHGETDGNKALRVQGWTDIPLNDKGIAQAKASAKAVLGLFKSSPLVCYSSPLLRAYDTATAIVPRESILCDDALREWNLGALEGMTKEQAMARHAEDWSIFSQWANPWVPQKDAETPLTKGESMEQLRWRVVTFINTLALQQDAKNEDNQPILIVTHGGVLGQLLRHVVQTNQKDTTTTYQRPGNACISRFWLDFTTTTTTTSPNDPQWSIESWADTSHLTGDLAPIAVDYDKPKQ